MDDERRERYERRLLEARDAAEEDLRRFEREEEEPQPMSAGNVPRVNIGADAGSDEQETHTDFTQAARLSERLTLIDEALRAVRDDLDDFMRCSRCGRTIDEERRRMVPWTRMCPSCAGESEREAGTPVHGG
jgi:RNA polymerase-binding transcription factor DksA